jgi:hypothetical protein
MGDVMIFEDIYEPIKFQMKNINGELFDCETKFRTTADNILLEKLGKYEYDEKMQLIGEGYNERALKMAVIYCGKDEKFWEQFSGNSLNNMILKLAEKEKEKYKKKQVTK